MELINFLAINEQKGHLDAIRGWLWNRTERIRWEVASSKGWRDQVREAEVIVVDAEEGACDSSEVWNIVQDSGCPVIVVKATALVDLVEAFPKMISLSKDWDRKADMQKGLNDLLSRLGITECSAATVDFDRKNLGLMRTLSSLHGVDFGNHGKPAIAPWLRLSIAKYFGTDKLMKLRSVTGGWSGTPLLQVVRNGDGYYLKFFDKRERLKEECKAHIEAKRDWLGDRAAEVKFIDGLPETPEGVVEAFPEKSERYPLCLRSASEGASGQRLTLYDLYATQAYPKVSEALRSTLTILAQKHVTIEKHAPIENRSHKVGPSDTQTFFLNDLERQSIIQDNLHDLRRTLRQLSADWDRREQAILAFTTSEYPAWLADDTPVVKGCIHGDLNSRNCLFAPDDASDVRFIDLGGYLPNGFLVHDLSMLEASIKWAAMGVEMEPRYDFGDIDTALLKDARSLEEVSTKKGLAFTQDDLFEALPFHRKSVNCALTRAYSLVAQIRERAAKLCETDYLGGSCDPRGNHYFAALLGWNLRWLKLPYVRRMKKTLALYSTSLILDKFR